ncbi:hypothetical protein [Nodularia spumigena]|uniref:hypothetical protein n=1 Tax=Nodularia spumigena TaxID=70799 RepID=UPI002B20A711|nr:hypothetical protein [Nodularia spumigena]MEA5558188.1 hypothetical protein [Nodularia spumigena CH309]
MQRVTVRSPFSHKLGERSFLGCWVRSLLGMLGERSLFWDVGERYFIISKATREILK